MSTPTPRTDAAWASSFEPCEYRAAHTARTMRDECATLERELAAERQKVRALAAILESICEEWGKNHDANPIGAGQRMSTMAGKALEKLEQDEENS